MADRSTSPAPLVDAFDHTQDLGLDPLAIHATACPVGDSKFALNLQWIRQVVCQAFRCHGVRDMTISLSGSLSSVTMNAGVPRTSPARPTW
jgi:hypothetical protein